MKEFLGKLNMGQGADETGKIMRTTTFSIIAYAQFVVTLIIFTLLFFSHFTFSTVPTYSMFPTMNKGTLCFCSRNVDELKRGDIVSFYGEGAEASAKSGISGAIENTRSVMQGEKLYVKRLMGLPGDTVAITEGQLYINGEKQNEPYLFEEYANNDFAEIELGEDEYFFLGDNRNNSRDSRYMGPIHGNAIFARVLVVIPSIFDKTENPNHTHK